MSPHNAVNEMVAPFHGSLSFPGSGGDSSVVRGIQRYWCSFDGPLARRSFFGSFKGDESRSAGGGRGAQSGWR